MRLSLYFFRQYLPAFIIGWIVFTFVFLLDKLFDLIDLILNKGVEFHTVGTLFALFIPTAFPLSVPIAILVGCMVTFGRLSEENEITAVRAAGISLGRILWMFPLFAFLISLFLLPFNTSVVPKINRSFRGIYQKIVTADPLFNIAPKKFFSIKNIKIFAQQVDLKNKTMSDLFVYQLPRGNQPSERIFARSGIVDANRSLFRLTLKAGQLQRYDPRDPGRLIHTTFGEYEITIPLQQEEDVKSTRLRNYESAKLKKLIQDNKKKGFTTAPIKAEMAIRTALAFAPLCLMSIGIPLATTLRRGGRAFNTGVSLILIFSYYLLLIFGRTLAEKGILQADIALWSANIGCLFIGTILFKRLLKK